MRPKSILELLRLDNCTTPKLRARPMTGRITHEISKLTGPSSLLDTSVDTTDTGDTTGANVSDTDKKDTPTDENNDTGPPATSEIPPGHSAQYPPATSPSSSSSCYATPITSPNATKIEQPQVYYLQLSQLKVPTHDQPCVPVELHNQQWTSHEPTVKEGQKERPLRPARQRNSKKSKPWMKLCKGYRKCVHRYCTYSRIHGGPPLPARYETQVKIAV